VYSDVVQGGARPGRRREAINSDSVELVARAFFRAAQAERGGQPRVSRVRNVLFTTQVKVRRVKIAVVDRRKNKQRRQHQHVADSFSLHYIRRMSASPLTRRLQCSGTTALSNQLSFPLLLAFSQQKYSQFFLKHHMLDYFSIFLSRCMNNDIK